MLCIFVANNFVKVPSEHKMFSPLSRLVDDAIFLGPMREYRVNIFDRVLWKLNLEIDHQKLNQRFHQKIWRRSVPGRP